MSFRGMPVACIVLGYAAAVSAATLVVDAGGGGEYTAIQPAIDAAAPGDIVLVKPGEYVITESITFGGKGIALRGEGGAEATTIRMASEPAAARHASVVVFKNGETSSAVLEGFTLTGGTGTRFDNRMSGGGVYFGESCSPALANCAITGNSARYGAGVYCARDSSPTLTSCTIAWNSGAGIYCLGASPALTSCTIAGNWDDGVHSDSASSAVLTNCTITGNWDDGVYSDSSSSAALTSCIVWDNVVDAVSGGSAESPLSVTYSCIEGEPVRPGEGNINGDPLFCGWDARGEVWVDPGNAASGDGSEANPYADVREATASFRLSLAAGSPCIGTGKDGADMGANTGRCDDPPGAALVVHLAAGTYDARDIDIVHGLSLIGAARDQVIVEGTLNGLRGGCRLSGLTVTGGTLGGIRIYAGEDPEISACTITGNTISYGDGGCGGGVYCSGASPALRDCTISGNLAYNRGGGVYCHDASPTLTNCTITGNWAPEGGGLYCDGASPILTDCTIADNSAYRSGGGVCCARSSSPTLTNCAITGNSARSGGGMSSGCVTCFPTLTNCTITGNRAESGVGGLSISGSGKLTGCTIAANSADSGPGGVSASGSVTMAQCAITGNAGGNGGGVAASGSVTMTDCTIAGNSGGSSVFACDSVVVTDCTITGNSAHCGGGGFRLYGSPTLVRCTIAGNRASGWSSEGAGGGGVSCEISSSPTLTDCTITGNMVEDGNGGGVWCGPISTPTLAGCRITGNAADVAGGGVFFRYASSPVLTDCAIVGNFTKEGGGIYCYESSPTLVNCTLTGNSANRCGGVYGNAASTPTLTSCIVWDNSGEAILGDADFSPSVAYSCIEGEPVWPGEGNINGDPLFCGWDARGEVWIDPANPAAGDGSEANPYADPRAASFRLSLAAGSPCIGAGKDGTDMGVDAGRCDDSRSATLTVHLAAGTYIAGDFNLVHRLSLIGAGRDQVIVEGTLSGLRGGCRLQGLTVTGGAWGGIRVSAGEDPEISDCAITGNTNWDDYSYYGGGGVCCGPFSSPVVTNCTIAGNSTRGCGGGVWCGESSEVMLASCEIADNSAGGGGGVYCAESSVVSLTDCAITANRALSTSGGGVYCAEASLTLTACTIAGNRASWGGGVYCRGLSSQALAACTIAGNSAGRGGGGVCCHEASPTLTGCTIVGNTAVDGGGVVCVGASPALANCTLTANTASLGGGVYCDDSSSPALAGCIVWDNAGGAILGEADSSPSVAYSCIEGELVWPGEGNINVSPLFCGWDARGEVWVDRANPVPGDGSEANPYADVREATASFRLSLAADSPCIGAGKDGTDMGADTGRCDDPPGATLIVHLAAGTYNARDIDIVHRLSLIGAGRDRVVVEGTLNGLRGGCRLSELTVTGGTWAGIRIYAGDNPEISGCAITGNTNSRENWSGGGVYCGAYSAPALTNCSITGNSAGYGGGVCAGGSATITNCVITGNSARGGGGGVSAGDSVTITNCAIAGNSAGYGGGVSAGGSMTMTNCTITGNSAYEGESGVGGGGVFCRAFSSPTLTNCTISGNLAKDSDGGGVYCTVYSAPALINCIVWGNGGPAIGRYRDSQPAVAYSCIEGWPLWPGEGNANRDPRFVLPGRFEACDPAAGGGCLPCEWKGYDDEPIAWRRWIEGDYRIEPGSSAIDRGSADAAPATDIDGNARPCGRGVDMGAYELSPCTGELAAFARGDVNSDGRLTISDAVFCLCYIFRGGAVPECLDTADADDDGRVLLADAIRILGRLFTQGEPLPAPFGECAVDPTPDDIECLAFTPCEGR